jgi:streptogramin lyase
MTGTDSVWYLSSTRLFVESLGSGMLAASPPSGMLDMYVANSGNDVYVTVPTGNAIPVFNGSLSISQSYSTTQGAPQYLVGSADGNSVWFSETTASGIGIGRIDVVNQRLNESQIATGGGIAGGIAVNPNSDAIYILEWSGTASPGHIYQVTP